MKKQIFMLWAGLIGMVLSTMIIPETNAGYYSYYGQEMPVQISECSTSFYTRPAVAQVPQYTIEGFQMAPELAEYLYFQLSGYGIEWWYEYALCQAFQESHFDIYSQNANGLDKGLYQFRITYWDETAKEAGLSNVDIFDPYAQIQVYAYLVAKRLSSGMLVNEVISCHFTGGSYYDPYYVSDVMHWIYFLKGAK